METLQHLYESILKGKAPEAKVFTRKALEQDIPPQQIISEGMNSAMEEVGIRFSQQELFLPEMMIAARAMKEAMVVMEPHIVGDSVVSTGKIVLGTIKDDLHDVGKNLVAMMFKGAGFDVVDLGIDVPKETFLESIRRESPDFVGISALLTTTLPRVTEAIEFLRSSGIGETCKILVGGAPVTPEFARNARADGYAPDAGAAIQYAKRLMES